MFPASHLLLAHDNKYFLTKLIYKWAQAIQGIKEEMQALLLSSFMKTGDKEVEGLYWPYSRH